MSDFYTFIVTSTINASVQGGVNVYGTVNRFEETLKTFDSIRSKVPNVKIISIDNSNIPLTEEQKEIIKSKVDYFHQIDHDIFTLFVNRIGSKGMGESYIMYEALNIIEKNNLLGKRVFKITGRYWLADSFDISFYEKPELIGKYAHKINQWDVSTDNFVSHRERVVYFETRLWSFCWTLFDNYRELIQVIFDTQASNVGRPMCNLERSHWYHTPRDKLYELETAHVEGYTAHDGVYKFE